MVLYPPMSVFVRTKTQSPKGDSADNFSQIGEFGMKQSATSAILEHERRLNAVKQACRDRNIDVAVFTSPENICYITGLDYEGYFALHALLVSPDAGSILFARYIEAPTVSRQTTGVEFAGYTDTDDVAALITARIVALAGDGARVGLQRNSAATVKIDAPLQSYLPKADIIDASGIVESLREVKSPFEIEQIKRAAEISDLMISTGLREAGEGVVENTVAAKIYGAMIAAGGQCPGFPPFLRSGDRISEPHTSWTDRPLKNGAPLLLELSGCVNRYHAPMARYGYIGSASAAAKRLSEVSHQAHLSALAALKPGCLARDVYSAWKACLDPANVSPRAPHCGYMVGLSFPPTWTGGPGVQSLHETSSMEIRESMVFHLLTWVTDGQNDHFLSDCVVVEKAGAVFLTKTPREIFEI
ncbi:M24 family metallopeptidase [Mesorhizobium sp. 131-2-5]|uniref:M24 family metallopeptidase n=1 Tax=Mesorhizobium sp. 131-2-5 TaxID=2744519 RepID=UPI001925242D|nr:Xaa-Pro peptidase family protein [Mesorhizobium sp. 131-2-5]